LLIYKVNYFNNIEIAIVPIAVLITASDITLSFKSYAKIGKINASETHVNKPNNLNMATN